MKKQAYYQRNHFFKPKAQASIEFSLALITSILFLVITCNLFVWINHTIVRRQVAYENTRVEAGGKWEGYNLTVLGYWFKIVTKPANPGKLDFYDPKTPGNKLKIFVSGGYQ